MKKQLTAAFVLLTLMSPAVTLSPALAAEPEVLRAELNLPLSTQLLPEIHFAEQTQTLSAAASFQPQTTIFGLPLNMGPIDRSLRGVLALGLIGTGIYGLASGQINTPLSAALIGVGLIPTATAASGYCPLYQLFGLQYSF